MPAFNPLVQALLTDRYQLTMAYAYWKNGRHNKRAVFDLFFRKCPFGGEFAIFAGLSEALEYVKDFCFTLEDIEYLKSQPAFVHCEPVFFDWLGHLDASQVKIYAPSEGSAVFPRVPLLRVEGPIAICQLLETALLNLINFPTLVATNAARYRLAAGPDKKLYELGLRRAQGPDGAMSASRYAYLGGFDGTSNDLAGKMFGLPVMGTQAHSFIQSEFAEDLDRDRMVIDSGYVNRLMELELTETATAILQKLKEKGICRGETNKGELAAFLDYAVAFPNGFLALIDTYDTLNSGLNNFLAVALALIAAGYKPIGVRIDSGDLSHLSKAIRGIFTDVACMFHWSAVCDFTIVASNDINEETLLSLRDQGHCIDVFGIGTHLVTCQSQAAMGGVYKLVELDGKPCIKLSADSVKVTIPGRKNAYRLYGTDGKAILDLMTAIDEPAPEIGQPVLCRHPFIENKRAQVVPSRVELVNPLVYACGKIQSVHSLEEARSQAQKELNENLRPDHLRPLNPTPYKVAVSENIYQGLHRLMQSEVPVAVLS